MQFCTYVTYIHTLGSHNVSKNPISRDFANPHPLAAFRAFGRLGGARASARSADSSICDRVLAPASGTLSHAHAQAQHAQPSRVVDCRACLPACLIPPTPQALGPWVLIYRKLEGLESAEPRWIAFRSARSSREKRKRRRKNCVCMCTCECACVFVCVDGGKDVCVRVRV